MEFLEAIKNEKVEGYLKYFAYQISKKYSKTFTFEDAKQELLEHCYIQYLNNYNEEKGNLINYLLTIIRHKCFSYVKVNHTNKFISNSAFNQFNIGYGNEISTPTKYDSGHDNYEGTFEFRDRIKIIRSIVNNQKIKIDFDRNDLNNTYDKVIKNLQGSKSVMRKRAAIILKLTVDGYKQYEIAKQLNVSPMLISKTINNIIVSELKKEFYSAA